MYKALLADDDDALCETMGEFLRLENYNLDVARSGSEAGEYLKQFVYDIILLDWEMPGKSGIEICSEFRSAGGVTPILMLTGKKEIEEREKGLDAGADDYLTKPFHFRELGARLRALLRRPPQIVASVLTARDITLDTKTMKVRKGSQDIPLQPMEFVVLEFLMRNPGEVFSPERLVDRLWESDAEVSLGAIYSCVKRLRKKLDSGEDRSLISSIYSKGYRLDP